MLTGALNSFLLSPIEMIKIQMHLTRKFEKDLLVADHGADPSRPAIYKSEVTLSKTIQNIYFNSYRSQSVLAFYRGLRATMIRDMLFCRKYK